MQISIIGSGRMAQGLVKVMSPHIKGLLWGSRKPMRLAMLTNLPEQQHIRPCNYNKALTADLIFHTLWFRDLIPWAEANREALRGKILVDIANPFTEDFSDFTTDWGTSAAEELQKVLPETAIVGAFKNTFWKLFDRPLHKGQKSDVYVTSDGDEAKQKVLQLLQPLPFRILDGGNLQNNRTIERMTLFERELAMRYGHYPYVAFRLFGMDEKTN